MNAIAEIAFITAMIMAYLYEALTARKLVNHFHDFLRWVYNAGKPEDNAVFDFYIVSKGNMFFLMPRSRFCLFLMFMMTVPNLHRFFDQSERAK